MKDNTAAFAAFAAEIEKPAAAEPVQQQAPAQQIAQDAPAQQASPESAQQAAASDTGTPAPASSEPNWFETKIKAKYGDRFKSEDEFFEDYEKKPAQVEVEKIIEKEVYPDELTQKLAEFVKKGGKHKDFYETQFTDWDNKSNEEVIKAELKQKHPKLNEKQLELLFKKKYDLKLGVAEDELTEDDRDNIELAKIELLSDSDKIRAERKAQQVKVLEMTPNQPSAQELEDQRKALEYKQEWDKKVPLVVNNLKELKFDIDYADEQGNKQTFSLSHEVDTQTKNIVEEIVKDPTKIMSLYRNKDGAVDQQLLAEGVYYAINKDKIVREVANKLAGEVKESFIKKNLINANFKPAQASQKATEKTDYEKDLDEYAKVISGRGRN